MKQHGSFSKTLFNPTVFQRVQQGQKVKEDMSKMRYKRNGNGSKKAGGRAASSTVSPKFYYDPFNVTPFMVRKSVNPAPSFDDWLFNALKEEQIKPQKANDDVSPEDTAFMTTKKLTEEEKEAKALVNYRSYSLMRLYELLESYQDEAMEEETPWPIRTHAERQIKYIRTVLAEEEEAERRAKMGPDICDIIESDED